jgi:hypothetical protein
MAEPTGLSEEQTELFVSRFIEDENFRNSCRTDFVKVMKEMGIDLPPKTELCLPEEVYEHPEQIKGFFVGEAGLVDITIQKTR